MKLLKKLTALALSATLLLSAMAPALASEGETNTDETFEGTIWISNPQQGATYHAYKLLDLYPLRGTEPQEGDTQSQIYGFQADSPWAKFFLDETTTGEGETATTVNNAPMANYFDVVKVEGDDGYMVQEGEYWKVDYVVTLKSTLPEGVTTDDVGANIAQAALAWVDAHTKDETNPVIAAGTLENASFENNSIVVTERGYYLVDTNSGSLGSLGTIGGDHGTNGSMDETTLTVDEKNTVPTLVKHVWDGEAEPTEDDRFRGIEELVNLKRMVVQNNLMAMRGEEGYWFNQTSASFYDTVHYRLYVSASKGAERYWIFDRLDPSLTLDATSFQVYKYSYDSTTKTGKSDPLTKDVDWTLETEDLSYIAEETVTDSVLGTTTATYSHTCSFILKFTDDVVSSLKTGEYLVVFYDAVLNDQAVAEANANVAALGSGIGDKQYTDISGFTTNETDLAKFLGTDEPAPAGTEPSGEGVATFGDPCQALVYSYYFDLIKTDKDDGVLDGATFQLLGADGTTPLPLVEYEDPFNTDRGVNRQLFNYQGTGIAANISIIQGIDATLDDLVGGSSAQTRMTRPIYSAVAALKAHFAQRAWKYYARTEYTGPAEKDADGNTVEKTFTYPDRDHHYRLATAAEIEAGKAITEFKAGHIRFVGLDAGTYYLCEVTAPNGYNRLVENQKIELSNDMSLYEELVNMKRSRAQISGLTRGNIFFLVINDGKTPVNPRGDVVYKEGTEGPKIYPEQVKMVGFVELLYKDPEGNSGGATTAGGTNPSQIGYGTKILGLSDTANGGVQIVNLTGTELPHTGGMGTTLFYIVGGMLVAGAGILLITKKRMSLEEE